ncbi:hypothetical protein TorRG33x02_207130 [Trema orientale]|uniref:DUF1985 domain-containing protein n=1 Tax=Trema orientale TaxID=63057 RepID=A0A2P5ED13_TREOI|nr:hypothetical protein TorRG33x02_207130 [Trema orientale]
MKLALLYFLAQAPLSNAKSTNVPDMCFRLVNDLDAFNAYLWGSYLWSDLKDQMKKRVMFRSVATINDKLVTRYELNEFPVCIITEIEPSEEELSEMRTRGLIAIEKASLKRKLVLQKESEAPQDGSD